MPQKSIHLQYWDSWRGFSLVFCLEGMVFNNSRGARINISYSIFDVPTNRLKTVSFQLVPLLPTKDWQTHWERGQVLRIPAFACCYLFCDSLPNIPAIPPLPYFSNYCSPRIILPRIKRFYTAQNKDCKSFPRPFWTPQLIGSGVSQASRPATLMWHFRAEHLVTSLFVCQIPAGLACCSSLANKNASNHVVLQGSNSCCYFIARLSLILQGEPGIRSDLFLISVGLCMKCVCKWQKGDYQLFLLYM